MSEHTWAVLWLEHEMPNTGELDAWFQVVSLLWNMVKASDRACERKQVTRGRPLKVTTAPSSFSVLFIKRRKPLSYRLPCGEVLSHPAQNHWNSATGTELQDM